MKKGNGKTRQLASDKDTLRPEYDFSKAVRSVTAKRYTEGTNGALLDPDLAEIFPSVRAERPKLAER